MITVTTTIGTEKGEEMVAIRELPPDVVNRIAAGEVVERPASVVKELVENAIDAGARRVSVVVEEGGRKRIRVRDDGGGIAGDDLLLAFRSHATSKLAVDERGAGIGGQDLFAVHTLGFRGEALASIASVADVEVVSRTPDSECAFRYRPARDTEPTPAAAPVGTTIDVRNIFFNTPARRKFLKAIPTELSHVTELLVRIALGYPEIAFRLEHGEKVILDLIATEILQERVRGVLGAEKARELLEIEMDSSSRQANAPGLYGFVAHPRLFRSDTRGYNFFVNGRWVRDRMLSHALREAYRGYQIPGRHPLAYLFLELLPDQVDINVHPQKTEVRLADPQRLHRGIVRAVRAALQTAGVRPPRAEIAAGSGEERLQNAVLDLFGAPQPGQKESPKTLAQTPPANDRAEANALRPPPAAKGSGRAPTMAFQVLESFIVTEANGALVLIDQHALHEKVLYEQILRRLREGNGASQKLLLPEVVRLSPELIPTIPQMIRQLKAFGFEVEAFGEKEVAVHAIPAMLDRRPLAPLVCEVAAWIRDAADAEAEGVGAVDGVVGESWRQIAALMACKQAVKAGMKLQPEEIQALLQESERASDPGFCPHGRPTSIVIEKAELERRFDRK